MKKNSSQKAKLSLKARILIGASAVVMVSMAGVIIYLLFFHGNKEAETEEKSKDTRATVVTEDNVDEIVTAIDEPVPDGSYEVVMNTEWNIDGKSSDALVENSVNNSRTVYFDVNLTDLGELVYSSPYLPVGERIRGFTLDKTLEAGSYDAVCTYHLVDDNQEEVSSLSVAVTIQVK